MHAEPVAVTVGPRRGRQGREQQGREGHGHRRVDAPPRDGSHAGHPAAAVLARCSATRSRYQWKLARGVRTSVS
ncbi:hypothetical protein EDD40_0432 [Saccharothrix texasensis]|uniref:Uncharacterized protein n=1 Tax=Saccharothrix texasensis TaxID=103734 RepID=A0A3N1GY03_9PSEU|nr:hypothetical protein EDD40_0432 [Saccharothrix texasensis]